MQFNGESMALQAYEEAGEDQDLESDYCEDLVEVYHHNGSDSDVLRYKGIHLMDKGNQQD